MKQQLVKVKHALALTAAVWLMSSCSGRPDMAGTIWLARDSRMKFVRHITNVDWEKTPFTAATDKHKHVILAGDKDMGLRFFTDNTLAIMLSEENYNVMLETLQIYDYSFSKDSLYIKTADKQVFSARYEYEKEKLTLFVSSPQESISIQLTPKQ